MSNTHEHDWQLIELQLQHPDYYTTWACHCGLLDRIKVIYE